MATDAYYDALSCNDILHTIHTALNSRIIPFDTAVSGYRRTFERISAVTSIPDAEALGIECHLLLDKIAALLAEHKALLEALNVTALSNVLGRALGVDEMVAMRVVEEQLEGLWEGYWDAFFRSCVGERREDVDSEVEFISMKIAGRTSTIEGEEKKKKGAQVQKAVERDGAFEDGALRRVERLGEVGEADAGVGPFRIGIASDA
ncbi:hypothetical protein CC80DRAFT_498355 [Byssothecium circinans]|uniref:Uncharacterized protein n=1 Tax=Byssothecium circinans TaxID=147558 RepID=A0A6A5TBU5_9PLEO|nr:hypothetical protein CC80DRAFT_498357 [Byssothecium circinans]KAF1948246.1 hypothetical protein CC80DRAFT_498355 [Byssothecium circinans]